MTRGLKLYTSGAGIIIAMSFLTVCVTVLGCCGAQKQNRKKKYKLTSLSQNSQSSSVPKCHVKFIMGTKNLDLYLWVECKWKVLNRYIPVIYQLIDSKHCSIVCPSLKPTWTLHPLNIQSGCKTLGIRTGSGSNLGELPELTQVQARVIHISYEHLVFTAKW